MRLQTIKCTGPTSPRGIFYTRETPKTPAPVPIDSRGLTRSRSQGPVSSLACMFPLVFSSYVSTHSRSSNVCGCFFLPNLCDWHQKPCVPDGLHWFFAPHTFFISLHHFHFVSAYTFFVPDNRTLDTWNTDVFGTFKVPMTELTTFKACTWFLFLFVVQCDCRSNLHISA